MLGCKNNYHYFCIAFERKGALSSAGSERLPYKQRVGGSNPSAPTKEWKLQCQSATSFSFVYGRGILGVLLEERTFLINFAQKPNRFS